MEAMVQRREGLYTRKTHGRAGAVWLRLAWGMCLALAGCGPRSEPPLRVGTHVWPGYETLFLAQEKGFFGDAPIRLVELPSASDSIRAFENGSVDAATLTLDEVLRLAGRGHEPRIIAVMDFSNGADAVLARPEISTPAALKGKTVGAEPNALGAYMLARALTAAGLTPNDIELRPMPIGETESAFKAGRVDAVVTFEPYRARLLAAGAKVLFDSSQIPGEIADVMVVRKSFLAEPPRALARLVDGHFRALEFLGADPAGAAGIMALREKITPDEFLASLRLLQLPGRGENRRLLGENRAALTETLRRLARVMCEAKILSREPEVSDLLDDQFVRPAAP